MVAIKAGSPTDVDTRHRKVAWVIYALLIAGFLAITAWQIYAAVKARQDPPTRSRIQDKLIYLQPRYELCPLGGFAVVVDEADLFCEWQYNGYDETLAAEELPECTAELTTPFTDGTKCVVFNSDHTYAFPSKEYRMRGAFGFNYTIPPDPLNDNATVAELEWTMYLTDDVTNIETASETYLRFGSNTVKVYATKKTFLDSEDVWEYDTNAVFTDTEGYSQSYAAAGFQKYLSLWVSIPNTQVTVIEEVDPLNITTTIGTIGGFWNYVGLVFGIIFAVKLPSNAVALWGDKKKEDKGTAEMVPVASPSGVSSSSPRSESVAAAPTSTSEPAQVASVNVSLGGSY